MLAVFFLHLHIYVLIYTYFNLFIYLPIYYVSVYLPIPLSFYIYIYIKGVTKKTVKYLEKRTSDRKKCMFNIFFFKKKSYPMKQKLMTFWLSKGFRWGHL